MRKFLLVISMLLCSVLAMPGQTLGYTVKGKVVDAESGKALESVHVRVPGRSQATVTNADGDFVLKSDRPVTELLFSYMGYRDRRQRIGEQPELRVRLQRENLQLSESSIVSGNPREIVLAALDRIWDSYCTEPELLQCFYRETVQKRSRYTYVAEAVARLYKARDDGSVYRDAAAVEKSRVLVSQRKADTLSVKTMGGPTQALTMDLVKNQGVIFSPDELALYAFSMEQPAYIGDRLQFVIRMTPAQTVDYALYNCTLYIDRELLTFTRVEASLDMSDPAKATRMILVSKPLNLRFFPEEVAVVMNYNLLEDGHSQLSYFRSTIRFACDWRKRLFKTRYTTVNELVITDVFPEAVPIPRKEQFRLRDALNDKAPEFLDPDFWADYNIIEPSESLENAIGKLRKGK